MNRTSLFLPTVIALLALPVSGLAASPTYVATYGSDANTATSCSRTTPCRSFTTALTVTDTGGEIIALDSGGYGAVTINKSVSIIAPEAVYVGLSAFSGNGITIATAAIDVVLRGLTINGLGATHGIAMSAGSSLAVENCIIKNFTAGYGVWVNTAAKVRIIDSLFQNNNRGGWLEGGANVMIVNSRFLGNSFRGVEFSAAGGVTTRGVIDRSEFQGSSTGIEVDASASSTTKVQISHSISSANWSNGVMARNLGGTVSVVAHEVAASKNGTHGFYALSQSSGSVRLDIHGGIANENGDTGVYSLASSGTAKINASHMQAVGNTTQGFKAESASGSAALLEAKDVVANNNGSYGLIATTTSGTTHLSVSHSTVSGNTLAGIAASGTGTTLLASGNSVTKNGTGLYQNSADASLFESDGTNTVEDNGGATAGTITTVSRI